MARLLVLMVLSLPAAAQTTTLAGDVTLAWEARLDVDLPTDEQVRDVVVDGGQVFATGASESGESELFVTATDAATGASLWVATYDGLPGLGAEGFSVAVAGSVVVAGGIHDDSADSGHQGVLLGLDRADGSVLWTRVVGSTSGSGFDFRTTVARLAVPPSGFPVIALEQSEFTNNYSGQFEFASTEGLRAIDPATGLDVWFTGTVGLHEGVDLRLSPDGAQAALAGTFAKVGPFGLESFEFAVQTRSVADGSLSWSTTLATGLTPAFGASPGGHAVAWSDDGQRLFACGDAPGLQVFALDAAGGATVWSAGEAGFAGHRLALDGAGGVLVAGVNGGVVRALEFAEADGAPGFAVSGPAADRVDALVLDRAAGRAVLAAGIGLFSSSDLWQLVALDTAIGAQVWGASLGAAEGLTDWASALALDPAAGRLVAAGELFDPGAAGQGVLRSRQVLDGALTWEAAYDAVQPADQRVDAALLSADGTVVFASGRRGSIFPGSTFPNHDSAWVAASSAADGATLWSRGLDSIAVVEISAGALAEAPAQGLLLVGGMLEDGVGHVTALDRATGAIQWQAPVDNHAAGYERIPDVDVVPGTSIALATTQTNLEIGVVALDLATGAQLWNLAQGPTDGNHLPELHVLSDGSRAFLVGSNYVFFGGQGDFLAAALEPQTGAVVWANLYDWSGAQEGWDSDHLRDALVAHDDSALYLFGRTHVDGSFQDGAFWASVDPDTGAANWLVAHPAGALDPFLTPRRIALAPDGSTLFGLGTRLPGGQTGTEYRLWVQAVDAATGQMLWTSELVTGLAEQFNGHGIAVTRDGAGVLVTAGDGDVAPDAHGLTAAFDADTGALLWTATLEGAGPLDESTRAVLPLPDGRHVITASQSSLDPAHRDLVLQSLELPALTAVPGQLSLAAGGTQAFDLSGGAAQSGGTALLLGTLSGTDPGVPLAAGLVLPLNFDAYTQLSLTQPNAPPLAGSLGLLDAQGHAEASFTLPAGQLPGLAGLTAHHAWLALGPAGVTLASNASALEFVP